MECFSGKFLIIYCDQPPGADPISKTLLIFFLTFILFNISSSLKTALEKSFKLEETLLKEFSCLKTKDLEISKKELSEIKRAASVIGSPDMVLEKSNGNSS